MTHFPDRLVTVTSGGAAMVMTVGENREKLEASVFKEAAHESICSRQLPKTCEVVVVCLAHGQVVGGVAQGCAASQKLLGGWHVTIGGGAGAAHLPPSILPTCRGSS
jgi:hypothetical protein